MIQTEQNILIEAPIGSVWNYVEDMERWAELMPGYREFSVIDADNSRWTLKVGVGGLVRTVNVLVHIDEWAGPERVEFSFKLEGDPVSGSGSYLAVAQGPATTQISLKVQVVGGGPMAPMWEAMGAPLLPQLAKGFAAQLKTEIEKSASVPQPAAASEPAARAAAEPAAPRARFGQWLARMWRRLLRSEAG